MIKEIAFYRNRNDEQPNIELGAKLYKTRNYKAIKEIVENLYNENKDVADDCVKVLDEIGMHAPSMIAVYVDIFIDLLNSNNSRLRWGSMKVLSYIAPLKSPEIYGRINEVIESYRNGSVITRDCSITVFASLCAASEEYSKHLFPLLVHHISMCRAKEVPQHAERASISVNKLNYHEFVRVVKKRLNEQNNIRLKRIDKLLKKLENKFLD